MRIKVRTFAGLREALNFGEQTVELPEGASVGDLIAALDGAHPAAHLPNRHFAVAVNRSFVPTDHLLAAGDEVALIPPVSGG